MRNQTSPEEDSAPGVVPRAAWRVANVRALPGYRLAVQFVDGTAGHVDLSRRVVNAEAGVFSRLRDPALFERVFLDCGAVTWPGEIDLAPDAMYDEIRAHGCWCWSRRAAREIDFRGNPNRLVMDLSCSAVTSVT